MEKNEKIENIAILWDLENVNPGNNSLFLDGLIEYAESFGRISTARAYGNFSNQVFARLARSLVKRYFLLLHIPRSKKNSSDIGLISDSFELLRLYNHITTYILVTGDSDFRFLILSLRRAGKKVNVVCNTQNASEDLLALADNYIDYRELLPGQDEEKDEPAPPAKANNLPKDAVIKSINREDWFAMLVEAVISLIKEKKRPTPSVIKMRMKKFNPNFDEKRVNYKSWSDFISGAVRAGFIEIRNERAYPIKKYARSKNDQMKLFHYLEKVLRELDNNDKPQFHELAIVNQKLLNKHIDVKVLGFRQFKDFIKGAEARKLVEYKVEGLKHYVKRTHRRRLK